MQDPKKKIPRNIRHKADSGGSCIVNSKSGSSEDDPPLQGGLLKDVHCPFDNIIEAKVVIRTGNTTVAAI